MIRTWFGVQYVGGTVGYLVNVESNFIVDVVRSNMEYWQNQTSNNHYRSKDKLILASNDKNLQANAFGVIPDHSISSNKVINS